MMRGGGTALRRGHHALLAAHAHIEAGRVVTRTFVSTIDTP